jgi:hypothetical protein
VREAAALRDLTPLAYGNFGSSVPALAPVVNLGIRLSGKLVVNLPPNFEIIDAAMAEILRRKTPAERLRIAGRMWQSARVILRSTIRTSHPDWTDEQVNLEIAHRISQEDIPPECRFLTTSQVDEYLDHPLH